MLGLRCLHGWQRRVYKRFYGTGYSEPAIANIKKKLCYLIVEIFECWTFLPPRKTCDVTAVLWGKWENYRKPLKTLYRYVYIYTLFFIWKNFVYTFKHGFHISMADNREFKCQVFRHSLVISETIFLWVGVCSEIPATDNVPLKRICFAALSTEHHDALYMWHYYLLSFPWYHCKYKTFAWKQQFPKFEGKRFLAVIFRSFVCWLVCCCCCSTVWGQL